MNERDDIEGLPAPRGVVLHVEDDDEVRFATRAVLATAGFEVRCAATAEAALELAAIYKDVDVLVVDYHLGSKTTGTEVAEAIARRLGHGLPTVILTGDPSNAEVPWLRNAPVWLARKPIDPTTLVAGLAPLVAFRRAMKEIARN
jgi:CheY-like chemotaxis protein